MLLAVNIGNTNVTLGLFDGESLSGKYRLSTDRNRTSDEYWLLLKQIFDFERVDRLSGLVVSCVVSDLLDKFVDLSRKRLRIEPLLVSTDMDVGIKVCYDDPSQLGVDRFVNAVGGYFEYGGPIIIVDMGTATTFDVVSERGEFLGGAIAPGIMTSLEALFERAPRLPKVQLSYPQTVIGRDTISNLRSGIYFGFVGQIKEIIERIKGEVGRNLKVIATGGLSHVLSLGSSIFDVIDPDITLKGLQIIYRKVAGRT